MTLLVSKHQWRKWKKLTSLNSDSHENFGISTRKDFNYTNIDWDNVNLIIEKSQSSVLDHIGFFFFFVIVCMPHIMSLAWKDFVEFFFNYFFLELFLKIQPSMINQFEVKEHLKSSYQLIIWFEMLRRNAAYEEKQCKYFWHWERSLWKKCQNAWEMLIGIL